MKIKIANLGPLEKAEFEIKPLTVFVGPNNTGKTWTAYTISNFLAPYSLKRYIEKIDFDGLSELFPLLSDIIQQVLTNRTAKLDIVEFASNYGEIYFNQLAHHSKNWLGEMIGTRFNLFENLEFNLKLSESKEKFLSQVLDFYYRNNFIGIANSSNHLLNALKTAGDKFLYIYIDNIAPEELPTQIIKEFIIRGVFEIIQRSLCSNILIFPSERTSLIYADFEAEKQDGVYQDSSVNFDVRLGLPGIFGSLGYLKRLSYYTNFAERIERAAKDRLIDNYLKLAQILETDILEGDVDFLRSETHQYTDLRYQTKNGIALELPAVSSMVKALTLLVLFLRYIAEPDSWIVIDEPEVNLHPSAQAQLMEFLTMLVNANLKVIMTTHSPYMVDHLVNLMKAATHSDKEEIAKKFYLKNSDAFIPKEKVSVNLFKDGTVKNILDEDGFIEWDTFSKISDEVGRLYFEL